MPYKQEKCSLHFQDPPKCREEGTPAKDRGTKPPNSAVFSGFSFASRLGVEEAGSLKMPVSVNRKTRAKSCSPASQKTFRQLSSCEHSRTFCNLTAHTNQGQVGNLDSCLCQAAELPATAVVVAETRRAARTSVPPGCQPALCQACALGHLFPRAVRPQASMEAFRRAVRRPFSSSQPERLVTESPEKRELPVTSLSPCPAGTGSVSDRELDLAATKQQ